MPIDAKRFSQIHIPVPVKVINGEGLSVEESLNVWIRPISPAMRAEWAARTAIEKQKQEDTGTSEAAVEAVAAAEVGIIPDDAMDGIVTVLGELIVRWDVTDAGEPVKPTVEFLRGLDDSVLMSIYTAIQQRNDSPKSQTSAL